MTSSAAVSYSGTHAAPTRDAKLVVAWQNPVSRQISPVGFLEASGGRYRFTYIQNAHEVDGFRPLLGFPNLFETYESPDLFPLFAQRVMSAHRPEYKSFLAELDLSMSSALTPMEILARSGGRRLGDTLQLVPVPSVDAHGFTECAFLVHGIRHVLAKQPDVASVLDEMHEGDRLTLSDEPENEKNPRAIVALCEAGVRIGWVPDLLLDYVHEVRAEAEPNIDVLHVNDGSSPTHLRVLARLRGRVPVGYQPFSGPAWQQPTLSLDALAAS